MIRRIGTYLPRWERPKGGRLAGPDEDAVTMAVAAGLAALGTDTGSVHNVVLVTRDFALLEGGNAAALLGGLGLPRSTDVVERLGGPPAALDALAAALDGTLVIAADPEGQAGAAAAVVRSQGAALEMVNRVHRSLPLRARHSDGALFEDEDPRLQRERGLRASLEVVDLPGKPTILAGVTAKEAAAFVAGPPVDLPTLGTSAPLFALAAMADAKAAGLVVAVEQATLSAASWDPAGVTVIRDEAPARPMPTTRRAPGPDIKLAFTAYERAFESKVRWEAARCRSCATLAFPPRHRCLVCGAEAETDMVALPRQGTVYTTTTVHIPVPSLASPYTLAVVDVGDSGVRALVTVTDPADEPLRIGATGTLRFRRVAMRAGIPDYGYAFSPEVGK